MVDCYHEGNEDKQMDDHGIPCVKKYEIAERANNVLSQDGGLQYRQWNKW